MHQHRWLDLGSWTRICRECKQVENLTATVEIEHSYNGRVQDRTVVSHFDPTRIVSPDYTIYVAGRMADALVDEAGGRAEVQVKNNGICHIVHCAESRRRLGGVQ